MAPYHSRQLLVWTFPTIAILLSYLWFKKKRIGVRSDPGGTEIDKQEEEKITTAQEQQPPLDIPPRQTTISSPEKKFSRSLSGVETAPIDIIIPRELRSVKSNPVVISDEDLDVEIEKIKSMKIGAEPFTKSSKSVSGCETRLLEKDKINISSPKIDNASTPIKSPTTTTMNIKSDMIDKAGETQVAQQEIIFVEKKLGTLKLSIKETPKKKGKFKGKKMTVVSLNHSSEHEERQSSERDSANHSPADVMLASPSLSSISDNHSEVRAMCLKF